MHWYAAMRKAAEAIERETQEAGLEAPRGAPGGAHQAVGLEMLMATKWAKKFVQATSPGSEETAKDYLHRLKALMEAAAPVSASGIPATGSSPTRLRGGIPRNVNDSSERG